jgi:hypothetical protein
VFVRLRRRTRPDSDHGAVAVIVALLLSAGVLLGSGALVIDVGLLYSEREQLQSGADAASFRVAMDCAKATAASPCTASGEAATALAYAQKNALDGKAAVQLCLNNVGCPSWYTPTACPALPTPPAGQSNGSYVEVRTATLTSTNATVIPPVFGGALPGLNYTGTRVGACARVSWGPPADIGPVFALGVSLCDWKRMTNSGANFYGPVANLLGGLGLYSVLGLTAPTAAAEQGIPQVTPIALGSLPLPYCTQPAPLGNTSVPRGYVWLGGTNSVAPDSNCNVTVNVGDYPHSWVLSGLFATNCVNRLQAIRAAGQPVLVPIYDAIQPAALISLTPAYHIVGFAPFIVTAYTGLLGGLLGGVPSVLTGAGNLTSVVNSALCGVSQCIYGYFTQTLVPRSKPFFGTGGNFGATVVGRTG